jgi:hypothetical protein
MVITDNYFYLILYQNTVSKITMSQIIHYAKNC